jgi:hypothetical protein
VAGESRNNDFAIADLVHDQAGDDDAKTKARESCAADCANLSGGESKLALPVVKNAAAQGKAHAGSENGGKARPQ